MISIDAFLNKVLEVQTDLIKQMDLLLKETNSFKSKVASRYYVQGDDTSLFTKRIQNQYIAKVERLLINFNLDLDELINEYDLMMEEHRQLSDTWRNRKDDPKYKTWYLKLTQDVLQEKADFRHKVEKNCKEINEKAIQILKSLDNITEINLDEREGFPELKKLLVWCSTASWEKWMDLVMRRN